MDRKLGGKSVGNNSTCGNIVQPVKENKSKGWEEMWK